MQRNMKWMSFLVAIQFFLFWGIGSPVSARENVQGAEKEEKILIMKELAVEGELDKPAIIIVPKARLLEREMFQKSFYNDIVKGIYVRSFKDIRKKNSKNEN